MAFNISRTVKEMFKAGAGAVHLEDQVAQKRCGHRPNKEIVSQEEMVDRVKAAVDGKTDDDFFIIARTDAFQKDGLEAAVERARACIEAGADGIFAEAVHTLEDYKAFKKGLVMHLCWQTLPSLVLRRCSAVKSWLRPVPIWSCTH